MYERTAVKAGAMARSVQVVLSPSQSASRSRPGGYLIIQGDTVRFDARDIFLPAREDLPKALTTMGELEGIVTGFSDSGLQPRVFAVVDVIARQSVVVPVEKLLITRFAEGQSH